MQTPEKMPMPEDAILRLKEDKDISMAACLEAEMTFMKLKQPDKKAAEAVYLYPELVKSKEDLFLFAMRYGAHLNSLQQGTRKVNPEVEKMFNSKLN